MQTRQSNKINSIEFTSFVGCAEPKSPFNDEMINLIGGSGSHMRTRNFLTIFGSLVSRLMVVIRSVNWRTEIVANGEKNNNKSEKIVSIFEMMYSRPLNSVDSMIASFIFHATSKCNIFIRTSKIIFGFSRSVYFHEFSHSSTTDHYRSQRTKYFLSLKMVFSFLVCHLKPPKTMKRSDFFSFIFQKRNELRLRNKTDWESRLPQRWRQRRRKRNAKRQLYNEIIEINCCNASGMLNCNSQATREKKNSLKKTNSNSSLHHL